MQRPSSQVVLDLRDKQEDSCYHKAEMGKVSAEMVRPTVTTDGFGDFDFETFRIAALVRIKQIRSGYLHKCTPKYCLKDRLKRMCLGHCFL